MKVERTIVCGIRSPEISPNFIVICTEPPGHKGDHKTIYSVDTDTQLAFTYIWAQEGD